MSMTPQIRLFWSFLFMAFYICGFSNVFLKNKLIGISAIKKLKKIETIGSFEECYEIFIEQPVDHANPNQGTFLQKIYLSHKSSSLPTVLVVNGYISYSNLVNEWSRLIGANQIYVEHRYFGESKPKVILWHTLNLRNVCSDLNKIRVLFNDIYPNKWVSTGISKGGMTALVYKYFYPEDVSATIALSASLKSTSCDTSFFNYIDSLSLINGCLQELKDFQKKLLSNKSSLLPLLQEYLDSRDKGYSYLSLNKIFDSAVLEIPFSIWQNNRGCETLKDFNTKNPSELFRSMRSALHDWFLSDDVLHDLMPYYYQAQTELGYYCYPTFGFKDLMEDYSDVASFVFSPPGIEITYSGELMLKVRKWLTVCGDNITYITGKNDPYSIFKIEPDSTVDALSLVLNDKNHNQVHFSDLDQIQKKEVLTRLNNWLE